MDSLGRYYHVVAMRCDLIIEAPTTDPAAAVDWWLTHEAQEAAQMEITIDGGRRTIKRAVIPRGIPGAQESPAAAAGALPASSSA